MLNAALNGALGRWWWIVLGALLGGGLGVPLSALLPKWYQAEVRLIPTPVRSLPGVPGAGAAAAGGEVEEAGSGEAPGDLGRLLSILHSRSLTDATIERFGLAAAYGARTSEDMRGLFWSRLASASLVVREGYVQLVIEDLEAERAARIANFMAAEANEMSRRLTSAAAAEQRRFVERRLEEVRVSLRSASAALLEFQQRNHLINLETQSNAVITALLKLKEELIAAELELGRLRGFASAEEPSVAQTRRRILGLRGKLAELGSLGEGERPGYFTPLDSVPSLRMENEQLLRELHLKTSIYEMLLREYELARLTEVRDTRSYQILDDAVVATKKSRPSRMYAVLGAVVAGGVLGLLLGALGGVWGWLRGRGGLGR